MAEKNHKIFHNAMKSVRSFGIKLNRQFRNGKHRQKDGLARWPAHLAACHYVDVEMVDGLTTVTSVIDDDAVTRLIQTEFRSNAASDNQQMSEKQFVGVLGLRQHDDRMSRDHEKVHGRLRADIVERHALIIFVDELRRNFTANDLAEYGVSAGMRHPRFFHLPRHFLDAQRL
jgi:hypothetical protein